MPRLKGNASDTALKKIVQKINDYELSSGEIVSDLELSNELNISRTPVREAMQQLIDIGLLERTATKVVVRSHHPYRYCGNIPDTGSNRNHEC